MAQSIKAIALGGQVSMVRILGGAEGAVDFMAMFASQASFQPIPTGSRSDLEEALRLVGRHGIHPVIDRVFEFDAAKEAMTRATLGGAFGKIVIRH